MSRLVNFLKLLKFFWDSSDELLAFFAGMQSNLFPSAAQRLRLLANVLEDAGKKMTGVQETIAETLDDAGDKINTVKVPKIELDTVGFYNKLIDTLEALGVPMPFQPPQPTRDLLNQVRLLEIRNLSAQTSPFGAFTTFLAAQSETIRSDAEETEEKWVQTAEGLRLLANVFDPPN